MSPPSMSEQLQRVARRHVVGSIPPDPSGEIAAMGLDELLMVYGNWKGRFIRPAPRVVHLAREFAAELPGSEHETAARAVIDEIESGADLTLRLSKGVQTAYVPRAERKTGGGLDADVDAMLAHSGIHHLHIGARKGDAPVEGGPGLLYVVVRSEDAYVIGVYDHNAWGRLEVLQRMVRNWPDADLLLARMQGIRAAPGTPQRTDEELWALIKSGVTSVIEIDGDAYVSLGITTARTSMDVTRRVQALMHALGDVEENGQETYISAAGGDPSLHWTPAVEDEHLGLASAQGFVAVGQLA